MSFQRRITRVLTRAGGWGGRLPRAAASRVCTQFLPALVPFPGPRSSLSRGLLAPGGGSPLFCPGGCAQGGRAQPCRVRFFLPNLSIFKNYYYFFLTWGPPTAAVPLALRAQRKGFTVGLREPFSHCFIRHYLNLATCGNFWGKLKRGDYVGRTQGN